MKKKAPPAGDGRSALVQGRGHLSAARQVVLRLQQRRHRRLSRACCKSSTTSQSLGVNAIWLLPFYPSPRRDDGYDIADYRGVHPDYGTLADFKRVVAGAHARDIRVITELVINHTSDQHAWFQRARAGEARLARRATIMSGRTTTTPMPARGSSSSTPKSRTGPGTTRRSAYYWHRFYSHQPDLNFDNPRVLQEVLSVMRFWLDLGVDGLRLDAVPYLVEREGTNKAVSHRLIDVETHVCVLEREVLCCLRRKRPGGRRSRRCWRIAGLPARFPLQLDFGYCAGLDFGSRAMQRNGLLMPPERGPVCSVIVAL